MSFNYDTLLESLASEKFSNENTFIGADEFYPGPFSNLTNRTEATWGKASTRYFDLLKLHGSINWYYSGNENFSGEPIFIDPIFPEKRSEIRAAIEKNKEDLVPLIIPPVLVKDSFMNHNLLRLQWASALKTFVTASDVYVIGYSLPVTDLGAKFLLMESAGLSEHTKWHVLLHSTADADVKARFESALPGKVEFIDIPPSMSAIACLLDMLKDHTGILRT